MLKWKLFWFARAFAWPFSRHGALLLLACLLGNACSNSKSKTEEPNSITRPWPNTQETTDSDNPFKQSVLKGNYPKTKADAQALCPADLDLRVVTVNIKADDEYVAAHGAAWKERMNTVLAAASDVYAKNFCIYFEPLNMVENESDLIDPLDFMLNGSIAPYQFSMPRELGNQSDLTLFVEHLSKEKAKKINTIMVEHNDANDAQSQVTGVKTGVAVRMGRELVAMERERDGSLRDFLMTLNHELGHIFGVHHVLDQKSIMCAAPEDDVANQECYFGPYAEQTILANRHRKFLRDNFTRQLEYFSDEAVELFTENVFDLAEAQSQLTHFSLEFSQRAFEVLKEKPEAAKVLFEKGIQIYPRHSEHYLGLGVYYLERDEFDKGEKYLKMVREQEPQLFQYIAADLLLADLYLDQGRCTEAQVSLDNAQIEVSLLEARALQDNIEMADENINEYFSELKEKYEQDCVQANAA